MTIRLRDSTNTLRTVKQIRVRDENNVLQTVKRVRLRDSSNFLYTAFNSLTVTTSPSTVSAYGNSGAAATLTTGSTLATPVGGSSPYTYSWALYGSSPYSWSIGTPSAASTTFTATSVPAGVVASAVFQVTVTDSLGATTTAFVNAYANNGQPYDPSRATQTDIHSTL